jgi:hypothetical protein
MALLSPNRRLALATVVLACAASAEARESGGSIQGWVEDSHGLPVPGAVVSVFGQGLRDGGLVAFTDSTGRVTLPSLPAGSYVLRAVARGRQRASARQITVLPDQRTFFSLSLGAGQPAAVSVAEGQAGLLRASIDAEAAPRTDAEQARSEPEREWRWLLRHKRRSTLESSDERAELEASPELPAAPALALGNLTGHVEFLAHASPDGLGGQLPLEEDLSGLGLVRLEGRLADSGSWSVGGVMAESQTRGWRLAGEFLLEPVPGHHLEAGSGYGRLALRPTAGSTASEPELWRGQFGALFVRDTLSIGERGEVSAGARWNYYGFLADTNHADPSASIEWRTGRRTRLRAEASARTLAPGGDMLTLSTLAAAPALAYAFIDPSLRPERVTRYELALSTRAGGAQVTATAFREGVRDQLVNVFAPAASSRGLRILNGRGVVVAGASLALEGRLARAVAGRISYVGGVAQRGAGQLAFEEPPGGLAPLLSDSRFHDVVAQVETWIDRSDTRLLVYYRISTLDPDGPATVQTQTRFNIQLTQGLPFIGSWTRADWDLLLGLKNLYYEEAEGATLDEWAVLRPPKRVVGGISVKF